MNSEINELIADIEEIASDLKFVAGYYQGKLRADLLNQLGKEDFSDDYTELSIKATMKRMGYEI
jgi:hypothetical protein